MADDLDELLGDLDILGQAEVHDHRMGDFLNEDSLGSIGEGLGYPDDRTQPRAGPRNPLEDIMDVDLNQQELTWATSKTKSTTHRTQECRPEWGKKHKGFLNLPSVHHGVPNAAEKSKMSKPVLGPKFKPSYAEKNLRSRQGAARPSRSAADYEPFDEVGSREDPGVPSRAMNRFKAFDVRDDIDGECMAVVSSSGRTVYVPCGVLQANVDSPAVSHDHGLLSVPIGRLIQECRENAKKSLEQCRAMEHPKLQATARPDVGQPWVREYAPKHFRNLLSDDKLNRDILKWLKLWDTVVFEGKKANSTAVGSITGQTYPEKKVALLSGPPGTGKTSLSRVIAEHCGYQPLFINASDDRTKRVLKEKINNAVSMKGMLGNKKPNCLILDEIDGMVASESHGAIEALLEALQPDQNPAKTQKKKCSAKELCRPIICICNDLYAPALRPLRELSEIFSFKGTKLERLVARLEAVCAREQVTVDRLGLQTLAQKTEGDIRACLNTLQFLSARSKRISSEAIEQSRIGNKDFKQSVFNIWDDLLFSQSVHRQSKRRNLHRRNSSGFHELYTKLEDFGEVDLVSRGIFENMEKLQFFDPTLQKSSRAVEALSHSGKLLWSLPQYMPCHMISAARQIASVQRVMLRWPSQETNANRKLQHNRAALEGWVSKFSPKALGTSQGILSAMYLIPCLKKILVPRVGLHQGRDLNEKDSCHVTRLANIMMLHGLKFDIRPRLMNDAQELPRTPSSIPLYPGVHLIHDYSLGDTVFVGEEAKLCVNSKIQNLRRRSHDGGHRPGASGTSTNQKVHNVLDVEHLDEDVAMSDKVDPGSDTMEKILHRVPNKGTVKKRSSTWLDIHRKEKRRRFMMSAQSANRPPLTFYCDEGKTDAVRRPASMQDFL